MSALGAVSSGATSQSAASITLRITQAVSKDRGLSDRAQVLMRESIATVNARVHLGAIKLPRPISLGYALSSESSSASFDFNPRTREGRVLFNPSFVERMVDVEQKVPGLGRAVLESLIVNEYHGILASALAKPGTRLGKASQVTEEIGNDASRTYLRLYHGGREYESEAIAVWDRISVDIKKGNPPYEGRPRGGADDLAASREAIRLLNLQNR